VSGVSIPLWRRLRPGSASAKLTALGLLIGCLILTTALAAGFLWTTWTDATSRASRLDDRSAALEAATTARLAEAQQTEPDADALSAATAFLARHVPERDPEAAMLDLLSALRLIGGAANVSLASITPLDNHGDGLATPLSAEGLQVTSAEVRLTTDHEGLTRYLAAMEAATPSLHAVALDITARTSGATAEDGRLSVSLTVSALSRARGPE
jgi:hypothetical protein